MSCRKCTSEMCRVPTTAEFRCFECPDCFFLVIETIKPPEVGRRLWDYFRRP